MKNKILTIVITSVLITSCVSPKVYKDLESKYARLKRDNRKTKDDLKSLQRDFDANQLAAEQLNQGVTAHKLTHNEQTRENSTF